MNVGQSPLMLKNDIDNKKNHDTKKIISFKASTCQHKEIMLKTLYSVRMEEKGIRKTVMEQNNLQQVL